MVRLLWVIAVLSLGGASAAADVMPAPGRPEFPDTPQPEPQPIPLEVAFVVGMLVVGVLALRRERAVD